MNIYEKALKKIKQDESCKKHLQIIGPTGPTGPRGEGLAMQGVFSTYEEFIQKHPTGSLNETYLVEDKIYMWDPESNSWHNTTLSAGPTGPAGPKGDAGPQGEIGPTGPKGDSSISNCAYIITFNNQNERIVSSKEKIPLDRKEIDVANLITLDTQSNIKFNTAGYYQINITLTAYILEENEFNPKTDIVSFGLKQNGTDNIYVGASQWIYAEEEKQITAEGIISVPNPNELYSLVNLSPKQIYLTSPDIKDIETNSYFATPLVTLIIKYLGRG